jgi:superfamily II DNA or RNA helicase
VIPDKANYLAERKKGSDGSLKLALSAGHPGDGVWEKIALRLAGALEVDVLSAFVQLSGLDLLEEHLFGALREGAVIRILVGDYLYISDPQALRRMHGWIEVSAEKFGPNRFQARLVELQKLPGKPVSFHPKAWRIADDNGGFLVVGSSNISAAALQTGVEWNLLVSTGGGDALEDSMRRAFQLLWDIATPLTVDAVEGYAALAAKARAIKEEPQVVDVTPEVPSPRTWQVRALEKLAAIRDGGHPRALVAVATGLGKTWLAAFDVLQVGSTLGRRPRVLVVAHRAEILAQAESVFRRALDRKWVGTRVSWYLGSDADLSGDLVIASIQKLSRPEGVADLENNHFDYVAMDEVHHAEAPSYRRVLAFLRADFTLGLTATPERTDGVDVATLFDDILAWQASIGDGITEGALVPFHYIGLKDEIDFQQIPWRNGRFDPAELEKRVKNSARMEKLWATWNERPAGRTLVFCCSIRHALFVRNWLRGRGVSAAAVFSGPGGDVRSDSLRDFQNGGLAALCAVDLFNEGVDIPTVDRVVVLRPTESKIVFIQQLGRGLRAADGKTRLLVIDFVGNHRIFAGRLIHLLSLNRTEAGWSHLRRWLNGDPADLPPGCLLDVALDAKDLLRRLLPTGRSAAIEAYRALRDELERRPSITELFHRGYLPATIRAQHNSWFEFVHAEGDLTPTEVEVIEGFTNWFRMIETTALNRSFKMVVLQVLLDRGVLWNGSPILDISEACRRFLLAHTVLKQDLEPNATISDHQTTAKEKWAEWWRQWPLGRWLDVQGGQKWFRESGGVFQFSVECREDLRPIFESMTRDVVEFRLAQYVRVHFATLETDTADTFIAKVSHSGGRPILFLPSPDELPGRPVGLLEVRLPEGNLWEFRLVKVACNVAHPKGSRENRLPELLRSWFGADAGLPGTGFLVRFSRKDGLWSVVPEVIAAGDTRVAADQTAYRVISGLTETPPEDEKFVRWVPVYDLKAAAGMWGPSMTPREIGWKEIQSDRLKEGMFVAWVKGHSMEPKIPSDSWCLFRQCPAGSRDGRILLVQFNSMTDPEIGGRYTIKKYHSEKTVTEDGWRHELVQLLPLNKDFAPIEVHEHEASEMIIIGEFVRVVE